MSTTTEVSSTASGDQVTLPPADSRQDVPEDDGADIESRASGRKHPLSVGRPVAGTAQRFEIFVRDVLSITRTFGMADAKTSVMHRGKEWALQPRYVAKPDARAALWGLLDVYQREEGGEPVADLFVRCSVCEKAGVDTHLFLKGGAPSNGSKHMDGTGKGPAGPIRRADHLQAALYLLKNAQGGNRTRFVAVDGSIRRLLLPRARREHHLRFVEMQIMTKSPPASGRNAYVRAFLDGLKAQYAPHALGPVAHLLTELASFLRDALPTAIATAKDAYAGAAFAHDATDLWTETQSHLSYGSVVLQFVDLSSGEVRELPLGVWRCSGRHNYTNIRSWVANRVSVFGLEMSDVASATTDSGARVRKAMIGFTGAWVPCASHSIHNAVRHAMGGSGETPTQRSARLSRSGIRQARPRNVCRNTLVREFLARCRATVGFFEHSPVEALSLSRIAVPEDPACRNLLPDVPTRWGSTFSSLCRLYAMWPRLFAFFRYRSLTADQLKRQISESDFDVMRQLIAVLQPEIEVTNASEQPTATISKTFLLVVELGMTMHMDNINVPRFSDFPLAVGAVDIEDYLKHNEDAVMEVDNRLYPCGLAYIEEKEDMDCLGVEARTAVLELCDEIDRLFFITTDSSKNWMKNSAVLGTVYLTSGGVRIIREVSDWIGVEDPVADAETAVAVAGAQLGSAAVVDSAPGGGGL